MENNNYKKWDNIRGEFQDFAASLFGNFIDGYTITESNGIKTFDLLINGTTPLHYHDTTAENKFIWHVPKEWTSGSKVTSVTRDSNGSIQLGGIQLYNLNPGDWIVLGQQAVNGGPGYTDYSIQAIKINQYLNIDWNKAAGYPGGISGKPSVEVTGNKLSSSQTIDNYKTNTTKYPTTKAVYDFVNSYVPDVSGKEDTSNKTNDISSNSTDTTKYPSAKGVYDFVNAAVENIDTTVEPVQTISASSTSTEIPSAAAVWAKVQELQQSINNIRPLYPMPDSWFDNVTNLTQLAQKINGDVTATEGKLYVGTIRLKGLPSGIQQGEVKAEIMKVYESGNKNILFTLTSVNVAPYHWERTWVNSSGFLDNKWIAFSSSKVNETT